MFRLNLVIGSGFFEKLLPYADLEVLDKIQQQHILITESILEAYRNDPNGYENSPAMLYFQSTSNQGDTWKYVEDKSATITSSSDAYTNIMQRNPQYLLLAEETDVIRKKGKKYFWCTYKEVKQKEDNPLNKFSKPYVCYLDSEKEASYYFSWLEKLFRNEKDIIIIDPYLFEEPGLSTFKEKFLPLFSNAQNLTIYCSLKNISESRLIREMSDDIYRDWHIKVNVCTSINIHARYIISENICLELDRGLATLPHRDDKDVIANEKIEVLREKAPLPTQFRLLYDSDRE